MSAGEIVVGGYRLSKIRRSQIPKLRRTMGIVFQDFRLIPTMTVFQNVAFAMHIVGASRQEIRKRVSYALNMVGLADKARSKPSELSGGEQQRVGLARALVNKPSLIIADEPTGNVDPRMSYEIVELLSEINRHGTTVIMVTHDHQLVRDFQRRVVMIEGGTVVADNADTYNTQGTDVYTQPVAATEFVNIPQEPVATADFASNSEEPVALQEDVVLSSLTSEEEGAFIIGNMGNEEGGDTQ